MRVKAVSGIMRKKLLWASFAIPLILSVFSATMIGITAAPDAHDIAVLSVTPNPTLVAKGELVNITVVVENQGNATEMFNVTVYYDTTTIETQNVSNLAVGANTSLTFVWNTTNVHIRSSTGSVPRKINATASVVSGETDTADNTLVSISRVSVVESPYLAVVPHSTINPNLTTGSTFTVSVVTDYNGSDITSYEFALYYNPSVLHAVSATNGDLITTDVDPAAMFLPVLIDNTNGRISAGAFFLFVPPEWAPLTSGPGTLANVTFEVVGKGESNITLSMAVAEESRLIGYTEGGAPTGTFYNIISAFVNSRQAAHGYFNNISPLTHDVSVISITCSPTSVVAGELVNITVVAGNQGTVAETFDVTVYYDTTLIETRTVSTLPAGANISLTFTWDTTGVPYGNYTIMAEAILDGDSEPENNIASKSIELKTLAITAVVDVDPDTLNLKSQGEWTTCYIELPEDYNVSDIDIYSIRLNYTFPVSLLSNPPVPVPTEIGDYDNDGIPDLMVKFNRTALTSYIYHTRGITHGNVTLTLTGQLADGTMFEGKDIVKVMFGGDADSSGFIELDDYDIWLDNYGKKPNKCPPNVYPDFNNDGLVDMLDFFVWKENFGATVPPQP